MTGREPAPGRVAFQGALGAFSHEACVALRPSDVAVGFETFAEAIAALTSGDCDCALIPVENSTVGVVEPAATLVREAGLTVVSETWRPIRMVLMSIPGNVLSNVRTVESHPMALQQCTRSMAALHLTAVEAFDTAGAAREVAEAGDPTRAALAPMAAAEVYGLEVLRSDMQDSSDNRTRFVLFTAPKP